MLNTKMSNSADVSVLFITYNRSDLLAIAVAALRERLSTGNLQVEYIASDDASTTEHLAQIRALLFDKIVFSDRNRGLGNNCNKGIAAARGRYILQVQDDCKFVGSEADLQTALRILDADCDVGVLQLTPQTPWLSHETRRLADGIEYDVYENDGDPELRASGVRPYSDQPHLKRREFCLEIGPYAEGVPMTRMEMDFQRRVASQQRWRVACVRGHSLFRHLGAVRSFNPSNLRGQRFARWESFPLVGPIVRVGRRIGRIVRDRMRAMLRRP